MISVVRRFNVFQNHFYLKFYSQRYFEPSQRFANIYVQHQLKRICVRLRMKAVQSLVGVLEDTETKVVKTFQLPIELSELEHLFRYTLAVQKQVFDTRSFANLTYPKKFQ